MLSNGPNLRKWQQRTLSGIFDSRLTFGTPRRAMVIAPPCCGKSRVANELAYRCLHIGQRALIAYTFSYLGDQFYEDLLRLGVPMEEIGFLSAERPDLYDPTRPIQLVSVQTLCSQGARGLDAYEYRYIALDEAHTSLNFKGSVDIVKNFKAGMIVGLTGTYFQGSLTIDEKNRDHGAAIIRAEKDLVFTAGNYADLVADKVLRPIRYFNEQVSDADLYSAKTIETILDHWETVKPDGDCTWFFCSKKGPKGTPIDMFEAALKKRSVEVHKLSGESTDCEVAAAKASIGIGQRSAILSVQYGTVGMDIPPLDTAVFASRHESSPNALYQRGGRCTRYTTPGIVSNFIDAAGNFGLKGHDHLEDALDKLNQDPGQLFEEIRKDKVGGPPPRGGAKERPPASGVYNCSVSDDSIKIYARQGIPGVVQMKRSGVSANIIRQALLDVGVANPDLYLSTSSK